MDEITLPEPDFRKHKSDFPQPQIAFTEVDEESMQEVRQYKCCSMPTYEDEEVDDFSDQAYMARKSNLEPSIKSPEAGSVISMENCDYMPNFTMLNKPNSKKK